MNEIDAIWVVLFYDLGSKKSLFSEEMVPKEINITIMCCSFGMYAFCIYAEYGPRVAHGPELEHILFKMSVCVYRGISFQWRFLIVRRCLTRNSGEHNRESVSDLGI